MTLAGSLEAGTSKGWTQACSSISEGESQTEGQSWNHSCGVVRLTQTYAGFGLPDQAVR